MNVLTGYIVKEVLKGTAVTMIILLTLFNLFTFSDELKDIGVGHYGLKEIFSYLALTSPRVFYELMPSAALLGSLFVVGAMGNNSEIIAMRAMGLSIFWVIRSVMLAGFILVVITFFVGEFVAPEAESTAQLIKTNAQNNEIVLRSGHGGLWLREGNRFINVRKIKGRDVLLNIHSYETNGNSHMLSMSHAEKATFVGDDTWRMEDIKQTKILPERITGNRTEKIEWKTSIDPDLLKVVVVKSDNMSLYDLFLYISFLKENSQKTQGFELAFWSRLVNPFIIFVMLMVSIPFVVSVRRGIGTGGRIMIGIIIGMLFNIFDKIAGHVGVVYGFNPLLMAVLPSFLVFSCAIYAVSRAR